jgi:phenylpropionate dioxygenase-like ring-hydroxylating dioxygenase large terminal subunit
MFVHQSQLRHILTPEQYYSEQQHNSELAHLFMPAWHLVATKADLPRAGDFLTVNILGTPLLIRNMDGGYHAFLNVCGHRHCLLTNEARGSDPQLRCQYHGWEYNKDGRTGRIPDAQAFRPFDRENTRLCKYRLETCGELIFVSFAEEAVPLKEFIGPLHATLAEGFDHPFRQVWAWDVAYPANWKVPVENSLESYHIPCLHPKSFGNYPKESDCEHDLEERHTTYRQPIEKPFARWSQRWIVRRLGGPDSDVYTHHHMMPHLTLSMMDVYRLVQMFLPTSPTTSRCILRLYSLRGLKRGLARRLLSGMLSRLVIKMARQVLQEDMGIFAAIQRGLESSKHPGVIGTREERVYVFQKYVAERCDSLRRSGCQPDLPINQRVTLH